MTLTYYQPFLNVDSHIRGGALVTCFHAMYNVEIADGAFMNEVSILERKWSSINYIDILVGKNVSVLQAP